ncbi:MAG: hypothetical protein ABI114_12245 [Rhodanobacter sp.]
MPDSMVSAPYTGYSHPDLWYHSLGSLSYKQRFAAEACTFFQRASGYADLAGRRRRWPVVVIKGFVMQVYRKSFCFFALAVACIGPSTQALAQSTDEAVLMGLLESDQVVSKHPDLLYRGLAIRAYKAGDKQRALPLLLKAARFADKPAQAMLAAMYWNGDGVPQDRALGYAWMDLAADRGYADLLASREAFWQQLNAQEREQAIAKGQRIYAEYGDKPGLQRLNAALQRERRNVTGSHTGLIGNLGVLMRDGGAGPSLQARLHGGPVVLGGTAVRGLDYYSPTLWSIKGYTGLKDAEWKLSAGETGTVEVGPLQSLPLVK